jgi:tripartite ATP-independent transporter DctP family solute receptor
MRSKRITRRQMMTAAAGLSAAAIMHWPANAAEFHYKYGSVLPADHPMNARVAEAADKIKEATSGRLEIACYPNSVLGGDTAMIAQAISGALQMYSLAGDILAPRNPVAGIMGVGFAFADYDHAWATMDGDLGLYYRGIAEKAGLFCMEKAFDHGFRQITTRNKPITSPDDLRGFKIRLPVAPTLISLFKHLGAAPTALNLGEVYSALQTGVVDGEENPLILIDVAKFFEVQKYVSTTNHVWTGLHCSFNVAAWKKLPPPIQDTVGHIMTEAATKERQDWLDRNKSVSAHLQQNGMTFNAPDVEPFRAVLAETGFYAEVKERMGPEPWALLEKSVGKLG